MKSHLLQSITAVTSTLSLAEEQLNIFYPYYHSFDKMVIEALDTLNNLTVKGIQTQKEVMSKLSDTMGRKSNILKLGHMVVIHQLNNNNISLHLKSWHF